MYLKPLHSPKASILLLEEDPFLRAGLAQLLCSAGYLLADGAGGAHLVLAGIGPDRMPAAALDLLDRSLPVILLVDHAAWSGLDFLDAANACGAVAVLPRPFSRAALLSVLAKALSPSAHDTAAAEAADLPSLGELLVHLDNPNFA